MSTNTSLRLMPLSNACWISPIAESKEMVFKLTLSLCVCVSSIATPVRRLVLLAGAACCCCCCCVWLAGVFALWTGPLDLMMILLLSYIYP